MAACFGKVCAKEASKQPRKQYNFLVPALFPPSPPPVYEPFDASTLRRIDKVQEYTDENVQRAPKVSRRLWRRIRKEHAKPGHLGYVKVGVHTYIALLRQGSLRDFALYAKELLVVSTAVIPLLLNHTGTGRDDFARAILGLELNAHFLDAQGTAEHADAMAAMVLQCCAKILPRAEGKDTETVVAAMHMLRCYVAYTQRLSISCEHVSMILSRVMPLLVSTDHVEEGRVLDVGLFQKLDVPRAFTSGSVERSATAVLEQLVRFGQDTSAGELVLSAALDAAVQAEEASRQKALTVIQSVLEECSMQWLLLSCLLKYLCNGQLPRNVVLPIVRLATLESRALPTTFMVPALVRTIIALEQRSGEDRELDAEIADCIVSLVERCKDATMVLDALGGVLRGTEAAATRAARQRLLATHIVVRSLQGRQADRVTYVPSGILTELTRLASQPVPIERGCLPVHVAANSVLHELLTSPDEHLKRSQAEQIQNSFALQVSLENAHSSAHLASAANALCAAMPTFPPPALPRTVAVLATAARSALPDASSSAPHSEDARQRLEVLAVAQYCGQRLAQTFDAEPPQPFLTADAMTSTALRVQKQELVALPDAVAVTPGVLESVTADAVRGYFDVVGREVHHSCVSGSSQRSLVVPDASSREWRNFHLEASLPAVASKDALLSSANGGIPSVAAAATAPEAPPPPPLVPLKDIEEAEGAPVGADGNDGEGGGAGTTSVLQLLDAELRGAGSPAEPRTPVDTASPQDAEDAFRVPPQIGSAPQSASPVPDAPSPQGLGSASRPWPLRVSPATNSGTFPRGDHSPTASVTSSVLTSASQRRRAVHVLPQPVLSRQRS